MKSNFTTRNTHPQGQEGQIFFSSTVFSQNGSNEFRHSNNFRGYSLILKQSGDKRKDINNGLIVPRFCQFRYFRRLLFKYVLL